MARRVASKRARTKAFSGAPKFKRIKVVPGYTRSVGYYGRFAGRNAEYKFFDVTQGLTGLATAGAITQDSFNIVPQGNTESERIGRKMVIKSFNVRGSLQLATTTVVATATNRARVIIYQDTQTNGVAAVVSGDTGILETASVDSFRNLANSSRFKILYDKTHVFNFAAGNGTGMAETTRAWSFYKKCNIPIEYDNSATTGVLTSQRSNNIGMLTVMESAVPAVLINYTSRIRYSDT